MSENDSIFGSLIYRAIGEPEYWHKNSVEALVKLLTDEYSLDNPDSLAQIKLGNELVDKLSQKETPVSAVMTVLDDAPYGLLLVDNNLNAIFHNRKIKNHLNDLLDSKQKNQISKQLRNLIEQQTNNLNGMQSTELIRLDYNSAGHANIYLRSVLQNISATIPQYLHYIILAGASDNSSLICEQVSKTYGLSEREATIVQSAVLSLAVGGSTKEIAEDLYISPNTVKTHLKSIYAKSGVKSLAALVSLYLQNEAQQLTSHFGGACFVEAVDKHIDDKIVVLSDEQIICYREYGDSQGEPLIVLHNSGSSRLNLPPDGDALAYKAGRRVIIPDRPGYGKSPSNDQYPQQWSQQLADFAKQLNLEKFDLLGNSLSVRYALEFAVKYPDKVSKLILVAPLLNASNVDKDYFCDWLAVTTELYERSPEFATEIYKLWYASASLRLDNHIEKSLAATISSAEKGVIDTSEFIAVMNDNFRELASQQCVGTVSDFRYCFNKKNLDLSQISTMTEVWVGSEDCLCSPKGVKASLNALKNKTFFEKEGYGEHIYYSQFEEIISLRS